MKRTLNNHTMEWDNREELENRHDQLCARKRLRSNEKLELQTLSLKLRDRE